MFTKDQLDLMRSGLELLKAEGAEELAARLAGLAASGEALMAPVPGHPLRCPACGNEDPARIIWLEDVPTSRTVHGMLRDGTIGVDDRDGDREWEMAHTQRFRCIAHEPDAPLETCMCEWPTPGDEGGAIDYLSRRDFETAGGERFVSTVKVVSSPTDSGEGAA